MLGRKYTKNVRFRQEKFANKDQHLYHHASFFKSIGVTSVQVTINNQVVASATRAAYSVRDAQGRETDWRADGYEN